MIEIAWSSQSLAVDEGGDIASTEAEHSLIFDAVLSISHDPSATVTEKAVEGSAAISDHKRPNRDVVSLEAIVTNTPLGDPPPSGYGRGAAPSTTGPSAGGAPMDVLQFPSAFDRVGDVHYTLRRLAREPTLVTLITPRRVYDRMTVVSVSDPQEAGRPDSARFLVELAEVRLAETLETDAPEPREARGRRTRNDGGQEATEADEDPRANQSTLEDFRERRENGEGFLEAAQNALGFGG